MRLQLCTLLVGLGVPALSRSLSSFENKCQSLAEKIELDYTFNVNIAEYVAPNTTIDLAAEGLNATCAESGANATASIAVGMCRLNLRVATSKKSEVYMEVWLPENWEGRTLMTGNGGLAGCIQYSELTYGASYGFASFGTNNGHNGTSGGAFFHQPDVYEDYAWRSVYTGAVVGKSITEQFYGDSCGKSYYIGCSTGGRQGWKAVQKNPELFDGVIVGAPVIDLWGHVGFFGYVRQTLGFNTSEITLAQWAVVQNEVLNQCDGLDGAHDGILEDPTACQFDWTPLLCSSPSNNTCLTPTQVEATTKLFNPITYNETFIYPGQNHGFEPSVISLLYSPLVLDWLPEIFRYLVYQDLSWDPTTFTLQDILYAQNNDPQNLNTFDGDISAFHRRGGKIIHWHGSADPLIGRRTSDLYYDKVRSTLNASVAELDEFYRYFPTSGVGHCRDGPGAWFMGQLGGTTAADTPDDSMLKRIVLWVEQGAAPKFVRGTKFINDTVALGVEFTRKHCKYPEVNRYTGTEEGLNEDGWACVEP
ncbi:tannase and feruloyl esterase [Bimuria novae-zelandiae CBS 107.79]|uniref:Carboxylic ester hydrolase n=1 Tax=Bimuria novae-zelandiae CBS 107.79 TaxID=1447943 RepID=A0A6A5URB0_9PLEO|nr:tannase and feruloyl esterase [Bimuria novae-zelandiae CBS 107.79]